MTYIADTLLPKASSTRLVGNRLFAALLCLLLSACAKQTPEQRMLNHVAGDIIVPLYSSLQDESGKLAEVVAVFCQAPNPTNQQLVQQQWRSAMRAWAHVQPIDFGPLEDANLRWKLHFWLDRKDITRKKVEAMLSREDALTPERISRGSVSVQGLAALEYLLFDSVAGQLGNYQEPAGKRRCELAQAIAGRIKQVTQQLAVQWAGNEQQQGFAGVFAQPGVENERYPDNKAALAALFGSLLVGLEVVKRNKLAIPLNNAKGAMAAKPYRLEAWRSQYSLALVQANIETLESLYRGKDGFGLAVYLAEQSEVSSALLADIDAAFIAVNRQLEKLQGPLFTQIKQAQHYAELVELHRRLAYLEQVLRQLPERLKINLGFNSNDGD